MKPLLQLTAALLLAAPAARAEIVQIPLSSAASSVNVTFCLQSRCDNDSSPMTGLVTLDLDSVAAPTQATLLDFVDNVTNPLNLFIQLGPGSTLSATSADVVFQDATPQTPIGPVAISSGNATFANVPAAMAGTLTYTASGLACTLLTNQGYACSDTIDLSTLAPATADQVVMAISSVNRTVSISTRITVTTPLDPNNPALGDVLVDAIMSGSVYVPPPPCTGDFNNDRVVDLSDLVLFLAHYGETNAPPEHGDLNGDHIVDLADLTGLLSHYGVPCPS